MRNVIAGCALALATMGCNEVPMPQVPIHAENVRAREVPTITVPQGWLIDREPRYHVGSTLTVFVAQSREEIDGRRMTVTASQRPWDRHPLDFAIGVHALALHSGRTVTEARAVYVGRHPASWLTMRDGNTLVSQLSVAIDGTAYIVLCTGAADSLAAQETCEIVLETVRIDGEPTGHQD